MATIEEKLKELRRELATRKRVYPNWISKRQITKQQAAERIQLMEEVVKDYEILLAKQKGGIQANAFDPNNK